MGKDDDLKRRNMRPKICLFGHFGTKNFGNEATLQTILYHLGRHVPEADIACVCTGFEAIASGHGIRAVPISPTLASRWTFRSRVARLLRKVFIGAPSELYRWWLAFRTLKGMDMFIIAGTGLLTDAFGLGGWGPYNMFKWSLVAKMRGCKLFFVSVGAGPLYTALGRRLVKSALSMADFRSYRDSASMDYLKSAGFPTNSDRVYPDLVFSLSEAIVPREHAKIGNRPVVGLGLMEYAGKYSVEHPSKVIYVSYLEKLVVFVKWLLAEEYDIRLLIGDSCDSAVTKDFRSLLKVRVGAYDDGRVTDGEVASVPQLLSELAATDIVVATRFHNVLMALLLIKPVMAISFHHKCTSLMSEMGLAEYCHDINHMNAARLIEQFQALQKNAEKLKPVIQQKVELSRQALDEQYGIIFKGYE